MLHIEAMNWQPHFPDRTSSLPQEANSVSSSQPANDKKLNVAQNDQPCTSIGNSTQDSLAWNWNKKSFLSRVVSWIKGEVGFVAYNNKVVVQELKENNNSEDAQKFYNINKLFGATNVSFFKRLKAVVCGDELKEVERDFESAKMEVENAKKMQKMSDYLSDFFVFYEDLRKGENGISSLSDDFISNLCKQISNLEKGMKNLFKDSSIDTDAKLEFKSKLLDDLIKLLDDKFALNCGVGGMIFVSMDFFNKDKVGPLKNLLFLKSRLEVYKQATQGHLYQAKMFDEQINYILVADEKQLNDYQLENDSKNKIEFLKVPGKNVSLDENISLDEKFRMKVKVDDELSGETKTIEEPIINGLQKGNENKSTGNLLSIDQLKNEPIWEYLKIDSSKVSALKDWVICELDVDKDRKQKQLQGIILGSGGLPGKIDFWKSLDIVNNDKSPEVKLCLGSMLLYNDEPIYREQNRKLFQLMQENEKLYDSIKENVTTFSLRPFDRFFAEEQKTILWKMFTAQWRRDFLEGRATISRR